MRNIFKYALTILLLIFVCPLVFAQKDELEIFALKNSLGKLGENTEKIEILNQLTQVYLLIDNEKAEQHAREALQLSRKLKDTSGEVKSLLSLAQALFYKENYPESKSNAQNALAQAERSNLKLLQADAQVVFAQTATVNNRGEAYQYLQKARKTIEDSNDDYLQAKYFVVLGDWFVEEDKNEALSHYQDAAQLYSQSGMYSQATRIYLKKAKLYQSKLQNSEEALKNLNAALQTADRSQEKRLLVEVLNLMGDLYLEDIRDYKNSLDNYYQSFMLCQEYDFIGSLFRLAHSLNGIARSYRALMQHHLKNNEKKQAEEYEKFFLIYNQMYLNFKESGYDIGKLKIESIGERKYQSSANPSNEPPIRNKLNEIQKEKLALDILIRDKKINSLEAARMRAELQKKEDSLRLIKNDRQIEELREEQEEKENQIKNLNKIKSTNQNLVQRQKNITLGWIIGLALLTTLILSFAFVNYRDQLSFIKKQKEKLSIFNERINRQEVLLRDKEDMIEKKEEELAISYAKLDLSRMESQSLNQMIQDEIKPPLESIVFESSKENYSPLLIHQAGKQILNLINSMSDVVNFNKNKTELNRDSYLVTQVIDSALTQVSEIIRRKKLKVVNHINPYFYAFFDFKIVERILLNLFNNSLKYTSNGGKLVLDAVRVKQNGELYVIISLNDDGQIIAKNSLSLVFEKYSPEDARPSGMGLAYVKLLVELHGGKVGVESNLQEGTTFYFTLPEPHTLRNTNQLS